MLQFVIGDAIVWWRACVIWQQNLVVVCPGPLLILVAIGKSSLSIFVFERPSSDPPNVCAIVGMVEGEDIPSPFELSVLISRNVYGIIPLVLSFSTNVLATSLIAYKAWCVLHVIPHIFQFSSKAGRKCQGAQETVEETFF